MRTSVGGRAGDIAALTTLLFGQTDFADLDNPYATGAHDDAEAVEARRHNVTAYLSWALQRRPSTIWLVEAPGVGGAGATGIPLTPTEMLGALHRRTGVELRHPPGPPTCVPRTARWIWEEVERTAAMPLLWNAVPHHPHPPSSPWTNRSPTAAEIDHFVPLLRQLVAATSATTIRAIGRSAERSARRLAGVDVVAVRHPAQGGLATFRRRMR